LPSHLDMWARDKTFASHSFLVLQKLSQPSSGRSSNGRSMVSQRLQAALCMFMGFRLSARGLRPQGLSPYEVPYRGDHEACISQHKGPRSHIQRQNHYGGIEGSCVTQIKEVTATT